MADFSIPDGTPLSLEQFQRLPKEVRGELVRGQLVREPPPGTPHGVLAVRIGALLLHHVDERDLGIVISESGYVTENDPPTVRGPDISFVQAERARREGIPEGYWAGAPDLAVEIISPSDRPGQLRQKVAEYLAAGATTVWVVDPTARTVVVHGGDGGSQSLAGDDVLSGAPLLPGFSVSLPTLFHNVPRPTR